MISEQNVTLWRNLPSYINPGAYKNHIRVSPTVEMDDDVSYAYIIIYYLNQVD